MKKNKTSKTKSKKNSLKPQASGIYDASRPYNKKLRTYIAYQAYNNDYDINVTESDLDMIRSRARDLFANTPAIRNAIAEIADFAVSDQWNLKATSSDPVYNKAVESFVNKNWGRLNNIHQMLRLVVKAVLRDGDVLVVLTESKDGTYPKLQLIPAHKIGNGKNQETVKEGIFAGYRIIKGAILNDVGDVIAYNVTNKDKPDQQISVANCQLVSEFDDVQQVRGESAIKNCIQKWEDIETVLAFELQGIKTAASKALIINAPSQQASGLAEEGDDNPLVSVSNESTQTGNVVEVRQSELRGGEVIVFDNTQGGGEMKQVDTNRPTQNVQAFIQELVRHAMLSLRWPMEFSVNLDMGGATAKTIAKKIDKRISEIQQVVLLPIWYRMMKYVIGKAAKNGYIPASNEWFLFEPTYPKSYSYEQFKDTKSDLDLYKLGILTATDIAAAEGNDFEDTLLKKSKELQKAHDLTDGQKVSFSELVQLTPNLNAAPIPATQPKLI